ncbi:SCO4225 family membrane protein [Streptomyces sp. NPDC101158]|uniref:SCO4225 family membrane protein n=1 Tax=Streptomyces sp. NPDC101158 TaxID=3366117 RepID=UPI00382F636A
MVRRWSKAEMWVPSAYLALVVAMLVYLAVGRDSGFFGVWPILATAPVSILLLTFFGPAADALDSAPATDPHPQYGSQPPTKLPTDYPSESDPRPADWVPDTSVAADPSVWDGFGFYAAVLVSALVNAAAIWALLRYVARRRESRSAQA